MDEQMRARVVTRMEELGWFHDEDTPEIREHMAEHSMVGARVGLRVACRDTWDAIKSALHLTWS